MTDDVRFTTATESITGVADLSAFASRSTSVKLSLAGSKEYPRLARVAFQAEGAGDPVQWTDYLHLGGEGGIVRIARFAGDFPPR